MFLLNPVSPGTAPDLVFSASDLVTAAECEYRALRILDEKLGWAPPAEFAADEMLQRAAVLGDAHEHRVLEKFIADQGTFSEENPHGVYEVVPAASMDRAALTAKHEESIAALDAGAGVVFQASFFDGEFHGRSDFLVRTKDGAYAVWDTKLARHAKVGALLQLAAYGDQLLGAGVRTAPEITLVLGNGTSSTHRLSDILPVYRERRQRVTELLTRHREGQLPVAWEGQGHTACGRCDYCREMIEQTRDVLLVPNLSMSQRQTLRGRGVRTIDDLAALEVADPASSLARLREQARMQTRTAPIDGGRSYVDQQGAARTIEYQVIDGNALGLLPPPSDGDIFFDFEGDPLWQDPETGAWGLEYLFGVIENPAGGDPASEPAYRAFWAHSRGEEKQAFTSFLGYVAERRQRHPDLHVYHYASYEKTALRRLSLTHVIGEDAVDTLLREGVLVDLYETVRRSLRISEDSYSLKKLEPLYMGDNLRTGDVTDAGASVVAYAEYCAARDAEDAETADAVLAGIRDYNRYDCLSTRELRNWLLGLARDRGITPATAGQSVEPPSGPEPFPEESALLDYVASLPPGPAPVGDAQAVAMVAAAVGYHRRERKQFWWGHFDRLSTSIDSWSDARDVFLPTSAEVLTEWAPRTPRARTLARTIRLSGVLPEGAEFRRGSTWFSMYAPPLPEGVDSRENADGGRGGWFGSTVLEASSSARGDTLVLEERLRTGGLPHDLLPLALTPDKPLPTTSIETALRALAAEVHATLPDLPGGPGLDLLRRLPPRLAAGVELPAVGEGPGAYVEAITEAVSLLESSYLAVQGPPGTGKTYVGARVISRLVARGWKVGVVAQSHAVVEHMIEAALEAGVPPAVTAKKTERDAPWPNRRDEDVEALLASDAGCLIGGTAWTLTGSRVPQQSLDLLVIDEAGQFSLANTLAVTRSTRRLLLLGDPQQLPQVTQGRHPEPIDESALGWLSHGAATLPEHFGYFLATSWRMHPALCAAVSQLAYDGKLESAPPAAVRNLDGVRAGVECVLVDHAHRKTSSPEEAAEVLAQVQRHLGLAWTPDEGKPTRPLEQSDLLVVAAYNAQVQLIRGVLEGAGVPDVRVGTVDKFQGQQAAVVIVSMACSAAAEAPRGIEFLLNRNRINVAVSRGQWRAVIIRSPQLTSHLPTRPHYLEELGAFAGLCGPESPMLG